MALAFEGFAQFGEVGGDLAGDGGADLGGVEGKGRGPDGVKAGAYVRIAQVIQRDAVAVTVGELGVALPLAREVGVDLDHVADIDDQQEGRPAIRAGDSASIAIGLIAGAQHGVIPAPRAALAMALAFDGVLGEEGKLVRLRLPAFADALLGLHHEMAGAVEVDIAARLAAGVQEGDRAFKAVVVVLHIRSGGFGGVNAQKLGQFDGELLKIGALTAARGRPPGNEDVDIQGVRRSTKDDPLMACRAGLGKRFVPFE